MSHPIEHSVLRKLAEALLVIDAREADARETLCGLLDAAASQSLLVANLDKSLSLPQLALLRVTTECCSKAAAALRRPQA